MRGCRAARVVCQATQYTRFSERTLIPRPRRTAHPCWSTPRAQHRGEEIRGEDPHEKRFDRCSSCPWRLSSHSAPSSSTRTHRSRAPLNAAPPPSGGFPPWQSGSLPAFSLFGLAAVRNVRRDISSFSQGFRGKLDRFGADPRSRRAAHVLRRVIEVPFHPACPPRRSNKRPARCRRPSSRIPVWSRAR